VRRISVGGTMARVAMDAFMKSARAIADAGSFESFAGVVSNAELNTFFADSAAKRK
jgi:2-methylisocitrate lyase-like PEP mutase family enzyme